MLRIALTAFVFASLLLTFFGAARGWTDAAPLFNETTVRINPATIQRGQNGIVSIDLVALGGQDPENAVAFSISFDPGQLSFVLAAAGSGASGANFIVNSTGVGSGKLSIAVVKSPGSSFTAGTHQLVLLTFFAQANGTANSTPLELVDVPVPRQVIDVNARPLSANWINGTVTLSDTCVYSISSTVHNFSSKAGNGIVNVTAGGNCGWSVVNNLSWVTVTGGSGGTGNGTVTFEVSSNTGVTRTGSLLIAGHTFNVRQGANFLDVAEDSAFYDSIGKASAAGITLGCNQEGTLYCPDQIVTRDQMAAFIIRALGQLNPPPPAQQRFADVFPTSVFYSFIDQMAERSITVGCDPQGTIYCPGQTVTREQMAAFIIRALGEFNPSTPGTQRFLDVPPASIFYGFIDQMALRGITVGCNPIGPLYCPSSAVTREQMAAFLVRAFGL